MLNNHLLGEMVDVNLDGDPFGTYVSYERVELIPGERDDSNKLIQPQYRRDVSPRRSSKQMPTTTKPSARVLRRQAKALGVEGWEDMDIDELIEAVGDEDDDEDEVPARPAKKSTKSKTSPTKVKKGNTPVSTKSPRQKEAAAKKSSKRAPVEVAENGNPFREGTQEWYITEELLKGGKRTSMVTRLKKKITITKRDGSEGEDSDYDYRLMTTGQRLQKEFGYEYTREGRGADGTIQVTPN